MRASAINGAGLHRCIEQLVEGESMMEIEIREALGAGELSAELYDLMQHGFSVEHIMQSLDEDFCKHFTIVAKRPGATARR
jgi:hypothetical protein